MKKLCILFVFLELGHLGMSQNHYPTGKGTNVIIDGGAINVIKPSSTGNWARGIHYTDQANVRYAGIGILGKGENPIRMYMGYGTAPWSGEGIYILPNGNVGVGVTGPTAKLHVNGVIRTAGSVQVMNPENSGLNMSVGWSNGVVRMRMGGSGITSSGGFDIQTAGDKSLMRLLHNGNVGIGTTSPDAKLAVNGVVHSKEVKIDLSGWSDFVFKPDYDLPPLEEVERHIKEKGYLKDIPSAEEVEKNGILLGKMDARLLQKIEELTLYTIAQGKQLQSQKAQLKEKDAKLTTMESRIEKLETLLTKILSDED